MAYLEISKCFEIDAFVCMSRPCSECPAFAEAEPANSNLPELKDVGK